MNRLAPLFVLLFAARCAAQPLADPCATAPTDSIDLVGTGTADLLLTAYRTGNDEMPTLGGTCTLLLRALPHLRLLATRPQANAMEALPLASGDSLRFGAPGADGSLATFVGEELSLRRWGYGAGHRAHELMAKGPYGFAASTASGHLIGTFTIRQLYQAPWVQIVPGPTVPIDSVLIVP